MPRQITFTLLLIFFTLPAFAEERVDAFLEAAKTGDNKAIRALLADGVDIQTGDWAGWPALNWAALMLRNEAIEILLDAGADIEYLAKGGKNSGRPLMMAAKKYKGTATVKLLVARGADVNGADQYGRTALIVAARYGRMETVRFLLEQGADPNAESIMKKWKTPLIAAKLRGHDDVATLLASAGALP
ncbi:MAG: ankyrin repeat domain-containing protein [Rhodospirillaceae bacterium]|nr:ankyrin repeat domain-containing protein [Rhodospirillaceae bacterium]MBT5039341.1 ankyrin repeat domain-containing protein [Rhodospirillaceae bacterium]MBT5780579.1 ankyrin repeat domain-containing protein [Rhodospirillaceae bacterium]